MAGQVPIPTPDNTHAPQDLTPQVHYDTEIEALDKLVSFEDLDPYLKLRVLSNLSRKILEGLLDPAIDDDRPDTQIQTREIVALPARELAHEQLADFITILEEGIINDGESISFSSYTEGVCAEYIEDIEASPYFTDSIRFAGLLLNGPSVWVKEVILESLKESWAQGEDIVDQQTIHQYGEQLGIVKNAALKLVEHHQSEPILTQGELVGLNMDLLSRPTYR